MLRIAKTENGLVQGIPAADPRITSFKGIPFAAPPVGANRWRAPQPAENWDGVLKAYDFAPISMQAPIVIDPKNIYTREWSVDPDIVMNEDCLYLNVWTPACSPDEKLPVFVWYFGGGLQVGHTAEMEFDGERIARRGIVVVTVNYRLNIFGFMCHPEITAESPDAPANFGHLDQQAGTLWVKRNIAAFGGDPDNITIGGQSAGGGSVMAQLTSPQNEGLFQKAIIMSGMITPLYPNNRMPHMRKSLTDAEQMGVDFFKFLGVSSLEEARKLDAFYLRDKCLEYDARLGTWGIWGTVVDQKFCIDNAFELIIRNKRWMVPVMLGHTSSEFPNAPQVESMEEFKQMAFELFGDSANEYLALCCADYCKLEEVKQKATVLGMEYAIRIALEANSYSGTGVPMYYYNFDAEIPGWDNPGTFHSVDLWFFFETLAKCWRPFVGKHYDLARHMCNYWANFIRSGDPNGKDSTGDEMPRWEPYTSDAPNCMVFKDKPEPTCEKPDKLMSFLLREYFRKRMEHHS